MNEREQIERTRRHQAGYKKTGFIGVYDHVLLDEQVEMADTIERLLAENERIKLEYPEGWEWLCKVNDRIEKLEAVLAAWNKLGDLAALTDADLIIGDAWSEFVQAITEAEN